MSIGAFLHAAFLVAVVCYYERRAVAGEKRAWLDWAAGSWKPTDGA